MVPKAKVPPLPDEFLAGARRIGFLGVAVGLIFGYQAFQIWQSRDLPIVTGEVLSMTNRTRFVIQRVTDLVIFVQPSGELLHVVKSRDTAKNLPRKVEFRFGGDPKQRIFFLKHEWHPGWIALIFWGLGGFLIASAFFVNRHQRKQQSNTEASVSSVPQ